MGFNYLFYSFPRHAPLPIPICRSAFCGSIPHFNTALTYGSNGVEYFEIMPSVKAITAKSLGTFKPILLAVLMLVTAKARLPQNGINGFVIIVQLLFRRYQRLRF
jgi:hypothetical protein